ncbi:MAG: ABC transporter permease [Saprospiraceae bacterium]
MISFALVNRYVNVKEGHKFGAMINVKGKKGVAAEDLTDELRSVLRARRRLKPKEKDDFAINEISILQNGVDKVFLTLNIAGSFIGVFALLVGMFSVANIMFVSVKERTGLIGVKKALGAKKYVILLEFLIESIVLCLIGGLFGLLLIGGSLYLISK